MKTLSITLIFLCIAGTKTIAQQTLKSTKHGDTTISFRVDTAIAKTPISGKYSQDPDVVNSFRGHFVKDVVAPGNTGHSLYKAYLSKGAASIPMVKTVLLQRFKQEPSSLKWTKLKKAEEVNGCKPEVLPMYYLTHNVVAFTGDKNLSTYFNLDTSAQYYRLMKSNRVVAIFAYRKGNIRFKNFNTADSLSYYQVSSMHKEPIAFMRKIYDQESISNAAYDCFGYFSGKQVVFATCQQGEYIMRGTGGPEKRVINKDCKLQSADAYYLGSDSTYSNLPRIINNANDFLKFKQRGKEQKK